MCGLQIACFRSAFIVSFHFGKNQKCRNLVVNVIIFMHDNLVDFITDCLEIEILQLKWLRKRYVWSHVFAPIFMNCTECFGAFLMRDTKQKHQIKPELNAMFLFAFEWITTVLFSFLERNVNVDWMRINASVIPNNGRENVRKIPTPEEKEK